MFLSHLKTALCLMHDSGPPVNAALLQAVTSGLQVELFYHGLFTVVEKEPPFERLALRSR